jgi:hypothetical protein
MNTLSDAYNLLSAVVTNKFMRKHEKLICRANCLVQQNRKLRENGSSFAKDLTKKIFLFEGPRKNFRIG